jgi:hypothetical protein
MSVPPTTVPVTTTTVPAGGPVSCPATPQAECLTATQGKLQYSEKKAGKEKVKLQWKGITAETQQSDFGDPATSDTSVALCIYDDTGMLVEDMIVDRAGQTCVGKECWKVKGDKGYGYKDKDNSADGVSKIGYASGTASKGKADAKGKNNSTKAQSALPIGVVSNLTGNVAPTIQMLTSNGFCVSAVVTPTKDDGLQYKAQKK